jgi:hypothetical protein
VVITSVAMIVVWSRAEQQGVVAYEVMIVIVISGRDTPVCFFL